MTDTIFTYPAGLKFKTTVPVTLVNNTQKVEEVAPAAGKRWLLLNIKLTNSDDVAREIEIITLDTVDVLSLLWTDAAVGAGAVKNWPDIDYPWHPVILDGTVGDKLRITWAAGGASAGGTDADGLVVQALEIDVD